MLDEIYKVGKIRCMARKLVDSEKIQMPSVPEIKDGMASVATRLSRKVKFNQRKLRPGPLMNAVFLWYLTRPEETQEEIAREFIGTLEGILEKDTPVELRSPKTITAGEWTIEDITDEEEPSSAPPKKPRRKSG